MDLPQTPPLSSKETIPYMADGAAVSKGSSPPSDDALQLPPSTLTTRGSSPGTEPREHAPEHRLNTLLESGGKKSNKNVCSTSLLHPASAAISTSLIWGYNPSPHNAMILPTRASHFARALRAATCLYFFPHLPVQQPQKGPQLRSC